MKTKKNLYCNKVEDVLSEGINYLKRAGIENPENNAYLLFSYLTGWNRTKIFLNFETQIEKNIKDKFISFLKMRSEHQPLYYITRKIEFMGLEFEILPDVFIPRQETELLVEEVIKYTKYGYKKTKKFLNILDIGTGCGNIAISLDIYLRKIFDNFKIYAIDIYTPAINLAVKNALNLGAKNVKFFKGDIFKPLKENNILEKFDIIVSNPPYIAENEFPYLQKELFRESKISLSGGIDGLLFYRKILSESKEYIKKNTVFFFEIGYNQKTSVSEILKSHGCNIIKISKDYSGIDRIIVAKNG